MTGKLIIVPTPIGNLGDISFRMREALEAADLIAAEDTRRTRQLLNHMEINCPMTSYHQHNRVSAGEKLTREMLDGKTVALVSDAGMPAISDPGADLVRAVIDLGLPVEVIPGPTAFVNALVLSGLSTEEFHFIGFLDRQKSKRSEKLVSLEKLTATLIFYEAPHRLIKTLESLMEVLGDRRIAVARELTKRYEEVVRGSISEALDHFRSQSIKGEFVLVVEGASGEGPSDDLSAMEWLLIKLDEGMDKKSAIKWVAKHKQMPKREVYDLAIDLEIKKDPSD